MPMAGQFSYRPGLATSFLPEQFLFYLQHRKVSFYSFPKLPNPASYSVGTRRITLGVKTAETLS
jgi:hypothetical protein